jgi:hypothetical protein
VPLDCSPGSSPEDLLSHRHLVAAATDRPLRRAERQQLTVNGRLMWRDARGVQRFATVVTRDVSDEGVYLECRSNEPIPLYRLVYLQIERGQRSVDDLPPALRDGRVLSAVYRVGPRETATGNPSGYALRLLVDPREAALAAADSRVARSIA